MKHPTKFFSPASLLRTTSRGPRMSVSLYDLLDVDEDATPAQIRTAWKAAIADLDPTDRKFRAFNDAAGVLLDADKRAAYDAELAAERVDEAEEPVEPVPPVAKAPQSKFAPSTDAPVDDDAAPAASTVDDAVAVEPTDDEPPKMKQPGPEKTVPKAVSVSTGPSTAGLIVAAVGAALALALAIVVLTWPGSWGGDSPADQVEQADKAEDAAIGAENAATEAIPTVLGYDYRTLDEDFAEASNLLTDDFAAKRDALFDQKSESGLTLREQVVQDKVVVDAAVSHTGLTRVSPEGDVATVVVYVSQDSQKGKQPPRALQMWATLRMVADGDDWLLDDICTETDCS